MEGTRAEGVGRKPFMPQATLTGFGLHAKRAPVIDPVAKLGKGDGCDLLACYAVELLAVALDESERRESIAIKR